MTPEATRAGNATKSIKERNDSDCTRLVEIATDSTLSQLRRLGLYTDAFLTDIAHQTDEAESFVEYACAAINDQMYSGGEETKGAPNKPMIAASPPVIWFQSLSPWIGPSLLSKVELPVFSLLVPSKPLNNPLVSNEATTSPVGPDGQKLCSFDGSSLVGTSSAANDMPCSLILLPGGGSLAVRTAG